MEETTGIPERPRGRPRRDQRADVPDGLLRALSKALEHKPANEITVREIAASAGTSPEMVRYYFNSKDGLIAALLDTSFARVRSSLTGLKLCLAKAGSGHSRLIVDCLGALYLHERQSSKLFNSEFARVRSEERDDESRNRAFVIVEALHREIGKLVERGIYRADLDCARMAVLIMSLTGCPVRLLDTIAPQWLGEQRLRDPEWNEEVALMVDACCLA